MATNKTYFNGERLKSARLYRGLTIAELAENIGISKQAISQFEKKNDSEPKSDTLFKLSTTLRFPIEYFYQESNITVGNMYFRSLSSTTSKERNAQRERIKILSSIYLGIEAYIKFPSLNLPMVDDESAEDVELLAKKIRTHWNLGNAPIRNIIDIMERNGIIVCSSTLNTQHIDAYSQIVHMEAFPVAIVVLGNDKESAFRRNFNAAHELGHLLLDAYYDVNELSKQEYREMEDKMNCFAGALLVPKEMYLPDLQTRSRTDIEHYIRLKRKYHVSAAALIVRAKQLGGITYSQYQYLMKMLSQKGYRTQEPGDKETPLVKPRYLQAAMKMIIEEDGITGDEFLKTISQCGCSISEDMVEETLNLPEGYLSMNNHAEDVICLERFR